MKRLIIICTIYFCLSMAFRLQAQPKGYQPSRKFAAVEVQADIAVLQKLLYTYHPSVFRYTPKDSLDYFWEQIRTSDSLTERQIRERLRYVVSKIRCGHTNILPSDNFIDFYTKSPQHHLPLEVRLLEGKLYVNRNLSQDTTIYKGCELLAVEQHATTTILQKIYDVEGSDGFSYTGKQTAVADGFRYFYTLFYGTKVAYHVTIQDTLGRISEKLIYEQEEAKAKLSQSTPTNLLQTPSQQLRIDTLYTNMAVLTISEFNQKKFSQFYQKVFTILEQRKVTHLVIDLRNNSGGKVQEANELLRYLIAKPFSYSFERKKQSVNNLLRYSHKGNWGIRWTPLLFRWIAQHHQMQGYHKYKWYYQPQTKRFFMGKVIVLVNGGTFSAAASVATYLKNLTNATLIGTETGGSETGTNALLFPVIELPHSKIQLRMPLYHVSYDIKIPDNQRGILPQYPITYTLADFLADTDKEMEKVYELLKTNSL